jgi:hypothetical protein
MDGKYEINYLKVQNKLFLIKNWRSVALQNYLHFFRNVLAVSGRTSRGKVSFGT